MDEKALLERVLEVLRAGGAEGDAYLEERRDLRLRVRDGKVEGLERADVRGLAVRAMREGRLGFVHTSAVDADGVVRAARKALELGRAGSPREDLVVPDPAGPGDGRDEGEALGLLDASIEGRAIEEKQEWAREAEAAARAVDPKIRRTNETSYDESLGARWIANTKGLFRHYRRSTLEAGVAVVAEDAGEMQPGEFSAEATRFADLPAPAEIGRRAAERGLRSSAGGRSRPGATPWCGARMPGGPSSSISRTRSAATISRASAHGSASAARRRSGAAW